MGFPGKGNFSGEFFFSVDDINIIYQQAKVFAALVTPLTIAVSFLNADLDKYAQFSGTGLGTISASITGGGYWE
ncbi:hypothetical protein AFK69_05260 [Xenorhabdus sp. GDc328]|nr:hypothetical protein AAY47_02485 [Xenorhabdus griffiniae]KOP34380.1 hypothetical protein AFK69_05260 [Xenorhabdus sp. GDc328]